MTHEVTVCKVSKDKELSRKSRDRSRRSSISSSEGSNEFNTDDDTASGSDYETSRCSSDCSEISESDEVLTDDLLFKVLSKFFMTSDNKKNITDVIKDMNNRLDDLSSKVSSIKKMLEDD